MAWTYRIVKQTFTRPDTEPEVVFGIHEAYDKGDVNQPHSISVDAIAPHGETLEELHADYDRMRAAFDKPILNHEDF